MNKHKNIPDNFRLLFRGTDPTCANEEHDLKAIALNEDTVQGTISTGCASAWPWAGSSAGTPNPHSACCTRGKRGTGISERLFSPLQVLLHGLSS